MQHGLISSRRLSVNEALQFVQDQVGQRYDPQVVGALLQVMGRSAEGRGPERVVLSAELMPGMTLSRDLVTPEGMLLLAATLLAMLTHTNVRTPRWLGWFIERPEMHSWHHARGAHRHNYSELPVFDLLFGTFHNPHGFAPQTGFHEGGSARVIEMMMGRDIARDPVS